MVETDQNNRSDRIPGLDPVDLARMQRDARKASARELDKAQVFLLKTLITVVMVLVLLAFV